MRLKYLPFILISLFLVSCEASIDLGGLFKKGDMDTLHMYVVTETPADTVWTFSEDNHLQMGKYEAILCDSFTPNPVEDFPTMTLGKTYTGPIWVTSMDFVTDKDTLGATLYLYRKVKNKPYYLDAILVSPDCYVPGSWLKY